MKTVNSVQTEQVKSPQTYHVTEIVKELNTDVKSGLNLQKVSENQKKFGLNEIKTTKKVPYFVYFSRQLKEPMIIILLVAAIVSFIPLIIHIVRGESIDSADWAEPFIILFIVIMNSLIGAFQESKANKVLDSLKKMTTNKAKVIRENKITIVNSNELTIGDIIIFEAGDNIYADARIIEANGLKLLESTLTGESVSVDKSEKNIFNEKTSLGDRDNMVYSGCTVVYGSGKAVVTNIGMQTEIGKIATMVKEAKLESSPFQKQLSRFGKILSIVCLIICFGVLVVQFIQIGIDQKFSDTSKVIEAIMIAISLAVAAIPEGLPLVITITMSIGIKNMAKQKAIAKQLSSVEALGSTSVICSDKTGTLTQNKMTLVNVYDFNKRTLINVDEFNDNQQYLDVLKYAVVCSNASIDHVKKIEIGDPTETCLVSALEKYYGIDKTSVDKEYRRLVEFPFDSERKLMSCIVEYNNKQYVVVKGAFDELIKVCKLTSEEIKEIEKVNLELSTSGRRVLGLGLKEIEHSAILKTLNDVENNLKFIGLLGIIDPIRPEVKLSIKQCITSGIKVVMITGDHALTAKSIAKELGFFLPGDIAITGAELDEMSDDEFCQKINKISVYARVSPANKLRIVKMYKSLDQVVAMTGDGVNDAPALREANIGCAMGITGTDASKDAADIILVDDNFSTIVNAIKQGRGIFKNILKVINFLIASNIGELIIILSLFIVASVLDISQTFKSIQILWINLVSDSFPAIALGLEKVSNDIMFEKPRGSKTSIFANKLWLKIIIESFMQAAVSLSIYFMAYYGLQQYAFKIDYYEKAASTLAFMAIGLTQLFWIFNLKSQKSLFSTNIFENKWLIIAESVSIFLVLLVCLVPNINAAFGMIGLYSSPSVALYYLYSLLIIIFFPLLWMEIEKIFFRKFVWSKNTNIKLRHKS